FDIVERHIIFYSKCCNKFSQFVGWLMLQVTGIDWYDLVKNAFGMIAGNWLHNDRIGVNASCFKLPELCFTNKFFGRKSVFQFITVMPGFCTANDWHYLR